MLFRRKLYIFVGVKLADNIIVATGSVVGDSFTTERIIIGGNPARVISTWDNFLKNLRTKLEVARIFKTF